jgi:hypothetical protein
MMCFKLIHWSKCTFIILSIELSFKNWKHFIFEVATVLQIYAKNNTHGIMKDMYVVLGYSKHLVSVLPILVLKITTGTPCWKNSSFRINKVNY